MKWYNMCSFKALVLLLCVLRTKGVLLQMLKSQEEVDEFQPLTLICNVAYRLPINVIRWIRNGKTEFNMVPHCSPETDHPSVYSITCESYNQYTLTINNVTRMNHGDLWHCREDHFIKPESNDVEVQVKVPISNISLFTEKQCVTVFEKESAVDKCVSHGGIPAGQIMWFYDKGTPDNVSDDVILTEIYNETITQLDNTVTTQSYVAIKATTALIGTSLYCKASNDNVNWLFSNGTLIAVLLFPSSVELTHPRTKFITVYEENVVYFECVTSPAYPASSITWYKLTNGSEVITSADGSSTTEMNDRTIVTRSWLSLTFSISDDWTFVYCTANNSAGTLTSSNRATVRVPKVTKNFKMDNSHDESTLAKVAIVLSSITGTAFVFFIVGLFIFKRLRSSKANPRENTPDSGHVNQADGQDITSSTVNWRASAEDSSYSTLHMSEDTTQREPYE